MGIGPPDCCVSLFHTQTQEPVGLTIGQHNLLTLPVTTTVVGQRVKLDSFVEITSLSNAVSTNYTFSTAYRLLRDDDIILTMNFILEHTKNSGSGAAFQELTPFHPNLTWVDIPPGPGTFNYVIQIETFDVFNTFIGARTRALNAIVFPPAL